MNNIIFQRTIGFARYFDSNVHKEVLEILNDGYDVNSIFKNQRDGLRALLNDLAFLDYSSWKLNIKTNKNTIRDLWISNIERASNIVSADLGSILTCPIFFNSKINIHQTQFYWHSFDYQSTEYLDTILKSEGENYLLQRIGIFKTVEEYSLEELDLLILNIKELETTTGSELLEQMNPKNMEVAKIKLVKFLLQQIVYHNTIILEETVN